MANSWDNVLLPPGYAYGFTGGPAFDTRISRGDGGGETRVQVVEEPVWKWSALRKNFRDGADVSGLVDWFLARRGALYGFLFLDPADFSTRPNKKDAPTSLDQVIGFGDGTTTRFRLRKQYPDPGGMTARAFPRRLVPMLGTATAPVAKILQVDTGSSIAPIAAVDGVVDSGATFLPLSQEVVLSSAPSIGAQVTWGGYFVTPVRFGEQTDKGLEATIAGFMADEAPFEIEGLPFDDPVPLMPGGSPYGHKKLTNQTTAFELSGRDVAFWEVEANAAIPCYLDDLTSYPTGFWHLALQNIGSSTITVRDATGASVGTVASGALKLLAVKEDASGNRIPVLV